MVKHGANCGCGVLVEQFRTVHGAESEREEEFGDLLFALVNYARFIGVNPEIAIRKSIDKFISRFHFIEERLRSAGREMQESTLEEMDALWEEAKDGEKGGR